VSKRAGGDGSADVVQSEIEAMRQVAAILEPINPGARVRVLWWSLSRFCPHVPPDWVNKVLTWGCPEDDKGR
jgi:hypothetical protein